MGLKEASLQQNGWSKLPSGLIIQWFTKTVDSLGNDVTFSVSFPIAFPTAALHVILSDTVGQTHTNTQASEGMSVQKFNATSVTVYSAWFRFPYPGDITPPEIRLFAIGY